MGRATRLATGTSAAAGAEEQQQSSMDAIQESSS
jgi:hypothetical protein